MTTKALNLIFWNLIIIWKLLFGILDLRITRAGANLPKAHAQKLLCGFCCDFR